MSSENLPEKKTIVERFQAGAGAISNDWSSPSPAPSEVRRAFAFLYIIYIIILTEVFLDFVISRELSLQLYVKHYNYIS